MTISEMLLPEFDQEMANTRKILDCVPEDKFSWKPHEKSMSLGRLGQPRGRDAAVGCHDDRCRQAGIRPRTTSPLIASTKAELLEHFDQNVAAARKSIAGASDEHLGKIWSLVYQWPDRALHAPHRHSAQHGDEPHDPSSRTAQRLPAPAGRADPRDVRALADGSRPTQAI